MSTVIDADELVASDTGPTSSTAGIRPDETGLTEQLAVAALVIVVMTVIATRGFGTIFSSNSYLLVALAGATLGALVVVVGRRFNLLFGEIVGVGLIAPMLVGPLAVGGTDFYRGLVFGWADILSATPPVDPTAALKALPFIAAFVGALAGTELFRIRELPGLAVVGPLATLALTALFSEQTRTGAIAVGLVLLLGLLVLARLHYASLSSTGLLVLGLVLGLVAAAASMASVLLPYTDEERRFDLRDLQTPPWDPLSVPSPLVDLKAGLLAAGDIEEPILRIRGDVPVDRWRLASLPSYQGEFWGIGNQGEPSDFVAVDTFLPDIADERQAGERLTFDVDILEPIGNWVPTAGVPERLAFSDVTDVRMSIETGTVGSPEPLQAGNSYEITLTPWVELADDALAAHTFVATEAFDEALFPTSVRNLAADFSTGIDAFSGARVLEVRDSLRFGSYELDFQQGHNFGAIDSFVQSITAGQGSQDEGQLRSLIGFEEIYTATGALMIREFDIPVRVGVGYVIPDDRWVDRSAEVFASDINAWLEVHIEGQGWMPIDVTPDRERQPEEAEQAPDTATAPFSIPPESPPIGEKDAETEIVPPEPTPDATPEPTPEPDEVVVGLTTTRVVAGGLAAGLGSLLLLAWAIAGYKLWRRRRRRNAERAAERIAGAWAELVDRVDEAGGVLPARATPAEAALFARSMPVLDEEDVAANVERLANHVSAAAFHPEPPSAEAADDAWVAYDDVADALHQDAGAAGRLRRAVDPRTLRVDEVVGAP